MRYGRAVEKLRTLAEACQHTTRLPLEEPFLREVYVFGELLDGADPIDHLKLAFVLNLPQAEVPWESQPSGTAWLVDSLRLDKGGFAYWWRSRHGPVWNHHIRGPVRFWSLDGPTTPYCERCPSGGWPTCRGGRRAPRTCARTQPPNWTRPWRTCAR